MGGAGYGIPLDAKWPDTSWLLMRWIQDLKPAPDDKTDRYLSKGAQPGRMSVLKDPGWQEKYRLLEGLSYCLPVACYKFGLLPEHPDMTMAFGTELHEAIFAEKDLSQAMSDADKAWTDIFQKAGYTSSVTPDIDVQEAPAEIVSQEAASPPASPVFIASTIAPQAAPTDKRS